MFAALFLLASSRMPTRTSPHRPISAPQSVQVTMLSLVEWAGTVSLLLPHLRHLRGQVCVSALIGSGMTLVHSGQSNYNRRGVAERGKSILKTALVKQLPLRGSPNSASGATFSFVLGFREI